MAKKGGKKRTTKTTKRKPTPKKQPAKQPRSNGEMLHASGLWLAESLVTLPRYGRIALSAFLALAITFSTFPLLTWFFRLIAIVTRNPDIILNYTFTQDQATLNVLLGISMVVGALFYVVGWRIYVGTVGETPEVRMRVVWYFVIGVAAVLITGGWLLAGTLTGGAPAT